MEKWCGGCCGRFGRCEIIAFAPQTFVSPLLRLRNKDRRWAKQIRKMYVSCVFRHRVLDMRKFIEKVGGEPSISIYVSKTSKLDCVHANHLADLPCVSVHEFEEGGHNAV